MYSISEKVQFIQKVFGTGVVSRSGNNIAVSCPACDPERNKKKFTICLSTDKNHCWSCDLKGKNLYWILGKHSTKEIQKKYKNKFLGDDCAYFTNKQEEEREDILSLPDGFLLLAQNMSSKDPDVKSVLNYCTSRGMSEKDMWYFKIGTCTSGRFRRRAIFPSFTSDGDLNYFVARSIDGQGSRKYVNADVKKTDIIFNDISIDWKNELTIVEGPFDLIKCNTNSICILGSNLSKSSAAFIKIVKNQTPVLLALDSDMAEKSHSIAKLLSTYGINVRIMDLKGFSDVGEMTRDEFNKRKTSAKPWNSVDRLQMLIKSIKSGSVL